MASSPLSDDPLLSVVVPVYNHERFVAEALESVYAQVYPRMELVVVDDHSSDRSAEIAAELIASPRFVDRFESTTLIRNEKNQGAHVSLNTGMFRSRGSYIALLNSDDYFGAQRLARFSAIARETGAEFLVGPVMVVDEHGAPVLGSPAADSMVTALTRTLESMPTLSFGFLLGQQAVSTGNFFFSRALLERIGGFADLKYCHDWDFILRAVCEVEPVYVPERGTEYYYRLHGHNSFRALRQVEKIETEAVLKRYFRRTLVCPVRNPKAPCHQNWPSIFLGYLRAFDLDYYWNDITATHPRYADPNLGDRRTSNWAG